MRRTTSPTRHYPTGQRNYVRVVAHDAYQGAAQAQFMQEQGTTKLYILNDKEAYGLGVATNVREEQQSTSASKSLGFEAWEPRSSSYEALMTKIENTGADGVFLGGLTEEERRPGDQGQGPDPGRQRDREAVHARRVHPAEHDRRVRR